MGNEVTKPAGDVGHPLAVTRADLDALTPEQRQAITTRKNANIVSAQLAGTNWGKGLDEPTRRAVGDWGQRNGIDVTTEIHVLGGNIYLNAQFYLNRLVGLMHRGHILDYSQELIQHDPRLDTIVAEPIADTLPADLKAIAEEDRREAFQEIRRRRRLRIEHGAPEKSPAGVDNFAIGLTTIILAALPKTPIRGVKWAPHDSSDPVGKNYPQETALTRSARRALKQCVTHIPELARWVDGSEEDAAHTVAVALKEYQDRVDAGERQRLAAGPEPGNVAVSRPEYLDRAEREDVTRIRGPVAVTAKPIADPYAEPPKHASDPAWAEGRNTGEPAPVAAEPSPATREAAGDLFDTGAAATLEDEIGSDDLDLLDPDERREYEAARARERSGR